jgi:hypothetical protein
MSRFFVTLNHPNGGVVPLVDNEEHDVATFNTFDEAKTAINENILGRTYGGRVYDTDMDGTDV